MYLGSEEWTSGLGLNESEPWRPWTIDGKQQMGGYVTRYEAKGSLDFLTIRGAGHMVRSTDVQSVRDFATEQPFLLLL